MDLSPTPALRHSPTRDRARLGPSPEDARAAGAQVAYGLAQAGRLAANLARRRQSAPEYVTFVLDGAWPELPPVRPRWQRMFPPSAENLHVLRAHLRAVAGDPRVQGVVLHLRDLDMARSELESLRELIVATRGSGKRVVAWATRYTTATYFVAAAADEVLLQEGGGILPLGLRRTYLFLADALARAGLQFDGVQISPYKSALDTFVRRDMSDEAREMVNWLADADYSELLAAIAAGRGLDEDGARALVDGAPYTDREALAAGAIDAIVPEEDLPAHLGQDGAPAQMASWPKASRRLLVPAPSRPGQHVALIRIEGNIVDGKSSHPPTPPSFGLPIVSAPRAGDLTVVQDARRALADDRAAAVVVYVDSGGGSATASEAMSAALSRLSAKKPLVVALGPVAASGGYYVATPARWIVAQPGTITGSIGVLTGKLVTGGLFDRLRFGRETVSRGRNAGLYEGETPFDTDQRAIVWQEITRIYELFLERVAASRGLGRDAVDAIGGGRVWTGRQALAHGLVDELGGLETAIAKARAMAGLSPRAPVIEVTSARVPLAPSVAPAVALALPPGIAAGASIAYAAETVRLLARAQFLYLCPTIWRDEG